VETDGIEGDTPVCCVVPFFPIPSPLGEGGKRKRHFFFTQTLLDQWCSERERSEEKEESKWALELAESDCSIMQS